MREILLICSLLLTIVFGILGKSIRIQTESGVVEGYRLNATSLDRLFRGVGNVFQGIPFAKPPIGPLRFLKPQVPDPWSGVLSAKRFKPRCPQAYKGLPPESRLSEDCLYINVFTPTVAGLVSYPVMVYIYGGGFINGAADDVPPEGIITNFVSRGIIFVSFNYRLGLLGQFTTQTADFPANVVMFDQIMAFRWVKNNIAKFGGDPNKITIFGESSGACSVAMHTFSPLSKGLFEQAIAESGNVRLCLDGGYDSFHSSQKAAQHFCDIPAERWHARNFAGLKECLATKTWQDFLQFGGKWGPIIDGSGGFFPDTPSNLAQSRPNIPMIIGTNRDEYFNLCTNFIEFSTTPSDLDNPQAAYWSYLKDFLITEDEFESKTQLARNTVDAEYRQRRPPTDDLGWVELVVRMTTDRRYHSRSLLEAQMWDFSKNPNVYLYSFDYTSAALPIYEYRGRKFASHTAELSYLFVLLDSFNRTLLSDADIATMDHMSTWWTNFAKYGNPTQRGANVIWKPLTEETKDQFMQIGTVSQMRSKFHRSASIFWNEKFPASL